MKNFLLAQLAFNLTAVNNDNPTVVLTATNEPGSVDAMEKTIYGPQGFDTPDYDVARLYVPEHIARHAMNNLGVVVGYLLTKLGELLGEDIGYGVEIFTDPETKTQKLVILPPGALNFVIPQDIPQGNATRTLHASFGNAVRRAYQMKKTGKYPELEISVWDARGEVRGEYEYHYDTVAIAQIRMARSK